MIHEDCCSGEIELQALIWILGDRILFKLTVEAQMTQSPLLDRVLGKDILAETFWQAMRGTASLSILGFLTQAIKEKKERLGECGDKIDGSHIDLLSRYIHLQKNNTGFPAWMFSNVIAGSDSVGTVMRTLLFHLLVYSSTLEKLHEELKAADLSRPFPRYNEVRKLPYLDACVQEAAQIHPPFALPFERVVPDGGITVLGRNLPEGTVVAGNPYVVNWDPNTFGEDAVF